MTSLQATLISSSTPPPSGLLSACAHAFLLNLPCLEVSHLLANPSGLSGCQICRLHSVGSEAFSKNRLMLRFIVQEGFWVTATDTWVLEQGVIASRVWLWSRGWATGYSSADCAPLVWYIFIDFCIWGSLLRSKTRERLPRSWFALEGKNLWVYGTFYTSISQ